MFVRNVLPALLAFLFCAAPLAAQDLDDPISTDRPGLGTGTSVVQPGRVQVEVGTPGVQLNNQFFDEAELRGPVGIGTFENVDRQDRTINFPTLLRVGLLPWLEARVSSAVYNFYERKVSGESSTEDQIFSTEYEEKGFPGFTVGAKAQLLQRPQLALSLVPRVSLPIGDDFFTADRAGFAADAVLGTSLTGQFDLTLVAGGGLNPVSAAGENDYALNGNFVGVVSRSLTEQIGGYVEDAENAGYVGAGATYQFIPTAQLDVFFDRGLNDAASAGSSAAASRSASATDPAAGSPTTRPCRSP